MRTAFREPDSLHIVVTRHPHRAETSVLIEHEENGLTVVIWDDWAPVPESELAHWAVDIVGVWVRTGPLAAVAAARGVRRRRGRPVQTGGG